jgi:beta-fructofuranosidase
MIRTFHWVLLAALVAPLISRAETDQEALIRAEAAVKAAAPRAHADSMRPIFHVTAPAQWVNDPNGPIFHKGYYHLFYQLTPYSDASGIKYWGHARSRNLANWEHLPIAIAPSNDRGEESIWSGCCTINGRGEPMIFYTSITTNSSPKYHAEQWAAMGDDDLIHWRKVPCNPVLSEALHGGTKVYEWRDPFIFRDGKRTFMVLGGNLNETKGGQAVVTLYETENPELTQWKYRGVLFELPDGPTAECPNFFKVGDEWVLFVSPYGKVQYYVGDFDAESGRFRPRTQGLLDHGPNLYAPNTMLMPSGRRLVWGWVNGFPDARGWSGCLSLPRELSFSGDGQLQQKPAPELRRLRGNATSWRKVRLAMTEQSFKLPAGNMLEIAADFELGKARSVQLVIKDGKGQSLTVSYDGLELRVQDAKAPLPRAKGRRNLKLSIFMDRSVLEVFANEAVCITKRIDPLAGDLTLSVHAEGDGAMAKDIQVWPMKTIW